MKNNESSDFLVSGAAVAAVANDSLGAAVAFVPNDSLGAAVAAVANDSHAAAVANDSLGASVATACGSGTCASCFVFEAANAELGPRRGGIVPAAGLATFLHLGFALAAG